MTTQTRAAWIFGSLLVAFILGVFVFGGSTLPSYKQQILALICALLAGLFGIFFTGSLLLNAELPIAGKWSIQGGAGFALFLIVLFWWSSGAAPVKQAKPDEPNKTSVTPGETPPPQKSEGHPETIPLKPIAPTPVSMSKDATTGQVNFACEQTLNPETPLVMFGTNPRSIDAKAEWTAMDNVKSYTASVAYLPDPTKPPYQSVKAVGAIRGLDKNIVGNCSGGGHGALNLHVTWVEDHIPAK